MYSNYTESFPKLQNMCVCGGGVPFLPPYVFETPIPKYMCKHHLVGSVLSAGVCLLLISWFSNYKDSSQNKISFLEHSLH